MEKKHIVRSFIGVIASRFYARLLYNKKRRSAQRRKRLLLWSILSEIITRNIDHGGPYCRLKTHVPIIRTILDPNRDTKPWLRVSRATLNRLLTLLTPEKQHGWCFQMELCVFLFWLASGASYQIMASTFCIPKTTIHRFILRTLKRILAHKRKIITFPKDSEQLTEIERGFSRLARSRQFTNVVGAIGSCHIEIKAPPQMVTQNYFNHESFYSVRLQAICDHRGSFLDIFVGYPSSFNNAEMLKTSLVYLQALYPPAGYFLLGDSEYPCLREPIGILVPYTEQTNDPVKARFNTLHSKAHCVIEQSFRTMKMRWHNIFLRTLEVSNVRVPEIVAACAIMHNVCVMEGDEVEEDTSAELIQQDCSNKVEENGVGARNSLAAALSLPFALPSHLRTHDYL